MSDRLEKTHFDPGKTAKNRRMRLGCFDNCGKIGSGVPDPTETASEPKRAFRIDAGTPVFREEFVGGKTKSVIKLTKLGLNVPESFGLSVRNFDDFVTVNHGSISAWINDGEGNIDLLRSALAKVSEADVLNEETRGMLAQFLNSAKTYAVRSSATAEDGTDSAFAGQFETILNVEGNMCSVASAIARCWASSFAPEVRPYLEKAGIQSFGMGILIMEQVDSMASGVLFQANPVSRSRSSWVINSSLGQGEGVVGGMISADEFVLDAETHRVLRRSIETKTEALVLDKENGGLKRKTVLNEEGASRASIDDSMIMQLVEASKKIRKAYENDQDIEFAFGPGNELFILQARPITTNIEHLKWEAPDVGLWQLNGHLTRPVTPIYGSMWCYGMSKGTIECSKIAGIGFTAVDTCIINGFAYFCFRQPGPKKPPKQLPPPFVLRMIMRLTARRAIKQATNFWKNKVFLDFLKEWDDKIKPGLIQEHLALQQKNLQSLSDEMLLQHLDEMVLFGGRMYELHSSTSMYNLGPVGLFVLKCQEWSKPKDANEKQAVRSEAFDCLLGQSKISEGLHGEFPDTIDALNASKDKIEEIFKDESKTAQEKLDAISNSALSGEVKEMFDTMLEHIKFRLADGYDVAEKTLGEDPRLIVAAIQSAMGAQMKDLDPAHIARKKVEEERRVAELKQKIPEKHHAEFDKLLREARLVARIRDERAIYTDLWGMGIVRAAILETGRRISARAEHFPDHTLILDADVPEIKECFQAGWTEDPSFWAELKRRRTYRLTTSARSAPNFIGGQKLVPNREHFPNEHLANTALATILVVEEIFESPDFESNAVHDQNADQSVLDSDSVQGASGAPGQHEGRVCLILNADDLSKVKKGDVIVTTYSSSLINIVLPLCGAIVTDFGATLCHAAIVSREMNIPCIVGTKCGTLKFKDGDLVHVDADQGIAKKASRPAHTEGEDNSKSSEHVNPAAPTNTATVN